MTDDELRRWAEGQGEAGAAVLRVLGERDEARARADGLERVARACLVAPSHEGSDVFLCGVLRKAVDGLPVALCHVMGPLDGLPSSCPYCDEPPTVVPGACP